MNHEEGGCLCGAIRYGVTGTPSSSIICHCRSCRKASAAPSVGWLTFDVAHFVLLRGIPQNFVSSPGVVRSFCATCGTPLTYTNHVYPKEIDVTTISLDDESIFPPTKEVWVSHKVTWEATDEALQKFPKGVGGGAVSRS